MWINNGHTRDKHRGGGGGGGGVNPIYSKSLNSTDAEDKIFWLLGVNIMPADALAPNIANASADMVLAASDKQQVLLLQSLFHLLGSNQIKDKIQMWISFMIFKTIQHVKS